MNNRAKFLPVNDKQHQRITKIREFFSTMYDEIEQDCRPSRETSLAITKLEEAQFWAIKGITKEDY